MIKVCVGAATDFSAALAAGATAQVNFELSARDRSVWDATSGGWKEVSGTFGVVVGSSSRAAKLHGSFTVGKSVKTDDGAAEPAGAA